MPIRRLTALLVLAPLPLAAQAPRFDLSVPNIMRGTELVGREPTEVRWSADGRWLYFRWLEPGASWREPLRPFRVRAEAGATPERLTLAQVDSAGPSIADGALSPDRRQRAVTYLGDLYVATLGTGTVRRLTQTAAEESSPAWSQDGKRVFFTRERNAWSLELATGELRQLTDFRGPKQEPDTAKAPQRAWVAREEKALLGTIRDRLYQDSLAKADRDDREKRRLTPIYLAKDEEVRELDVAPSGVTALVLTRVKTTKGRDTRVPVFVSLDAYVTDTSARGKAGDEQDGGRIGLLRLETGAVTWIAPVPGDSAGKASTLALGDWNDAGTAALVYTQTRDFKRRFLQRIDAATGRAFVLDSLRDSAWVGGPCVSCAGWMPGDKRVWFASEADGYAHLYTVAAEGGDRRQLTQGKWEILSARLADDRRGFELHARAASPFERQFYRLGLEGGALERITGETGGHQVTVSPDGKLLADLFSTADRPPELYVRPNRAGGAAAKLTTSPTAEWLAGPWIKPEIVMIPASDGVQVPARIYRPADFGATPNGAAVLFVHGSGYLQNAHRYWSSYFREYMFNHLLASRGYVVLDVDYRGSAGYGRDWRTAIYRHMGGRDLQDQVDASKWLGTQFHIDPERVGLYGGSYGGFITLMALFNAPKSFGAGAALRSVTDWAHYEHRYTARILNEPQKDSVAYRQSSPIYFAEGLEDPLLMAHGMVDTNVEFQDIVRLTQRLIELHKTGWTLAPYPVEDHGFVRPDSWTDEYSRILELFDRVLVKGVR